MGKNRLEAFSDGVLAIILTIMVLELRVPHGEVEFSALTKLCPTFISYVLSFIYIGIYWNNHHLMLHSAQKVNGAILWANSHLLFWLSLIPFVTAWMGENHFAPRPVALYGIVLFFAGFAYYILARTLISHHGANSTIAKALGSDFKGKISIVIYALAVGISFYSSMTSLALYALVALMWLIPDSRIEKFVQNS